MREGMGIPVLAAMVPEDSGAGAGGRGRRVAVTGAIHGESAGARAVEDAVDAVAGSGIYDARA